ncbi:MAG: hypothetical protein IJI12_03935 [Atopobiaceae bacterium]|nr:hypothetical protein [Atopobiaceae bacterium]
MSAKRNDSYTVSPELDELSCNLMGEGFDRLAEGKDVHVLLVVGDAAGNACSFEFADDGEEACLTGARDKVRALVRSKGDASCGVGAPRYYALCYEGAVADGKGSYADALLMEFGEKGCPAFSAYSLFEGRGTGDNFRWTDPAPAGEVESLL